MTDTPILKRLALGCLRRMHNRMPVEISPRTIINVRRKGSEDFDEARDFDGSRFDLWRVWSLYSEWYMFSMLGIIPVTLKNLWTEETMKLKIIDSCDFGGQIQFFAEEV